MVFALAGDSTMTSGLAMRLLAKALRGWLSRHHSRLDCRLCNFASATPSASPYIRCYGITRMSYQRPGGIVFTRRCVDVGRFTLYRHHHDV